MLIFLIFSVISSRIINQQNYAPEQKISTLLNKKVIFQKEEDETTEAPIKRNLASTTDKFHILSVSPSDVHINGGDEVEILIDNPKHKEVYCKIGLKVFRGLNKDNKTMICLLPQLSRQISEGQNKVYISLSFDKIHWCESYPLNILQEENSYSILAILSIFSFIVVALSSIKMIFCDPMKKKDPFGRRKLPKKNPKAFSKEKRLDDNEDDPFIFNRKVLGSSFL